MHDRGRKGLAIAKTAAPKKQPPVSARQRRVLVIVPPIDISGIEIELEAEITRRIGLARHVVPEIDGLVAQCVFATPPAIDPSTARQTHLVAPATRTDRGRNDDRRPRFSRQSHSGRHPARRYNASPCNGAPCSSPRRRLRLGRTSSPPSRPVQTEFSECAPSSISSVPGCVPYFTVCRRIVATAGKV